MSGLILLSMLGLVAFAIWSWAFGPRTKMVKPVDSEASNADDENLAVTMMNANPANPASPLFHHF